MLSMGNAVFRGTPAPRPLDGRLDRFSQKLAQLIRIQDIMPPGHNAPGQNVPRTKCPLDKMAPEKLQDKMPSRHIAMTWLQLLFKKIKLTRILMTAILTAIFIFPARPEFPPGRPKFPPGGNFPPVGNHCSKGKSGPNFFTGRQHSSAMQALY